MLIMADGQPLDHNFYMEVPDDVWENVNTEDEEGAKHKKSRAVSDMENVAWTRVLSEEDGSIASYSGGSRERETEREELIEEINDGDADWFPYEAWREVEEDETEEEVEPEWLDLEQYKVA